MIRVIGLYCNKIILHPFPGLLIRSSPFLQDFWWTILIVLFKKKINIPPPNSLQRSLTYVECLILRVLLECIDATWKWQTHITYYTIMLWDFGEFRISVSDSVLGMGLWAPGTIFNCCAGPACPYRQTRRCPSPTSHPPSKWGLGKEVLLGQVVFLRK